MKYDFDTFIDRSNNYSAKWDEIKLKFGKDDLLPMWVADMDFICAKPIIDAIKNRADQGIFGYTTRPSSYHEAFINWINKRHNWEIKKEYLAHSPGVVPALSFIIRDFTKPGDKIIIQPPVYYPFFEVIKNNNREIVENPLKLENGKYVMDFEDLEEKIDSNVKMLLLCSPHNPVGRVWSKKELIRLGEICIKNNILIISDEIHSDVIYEGNKHTPFASISEEFSQNSITCMAPSKTFNLAGLQTSIIILPNDNHYKKFNNILSTLDIKRNNCFGLVATQAAYKYGEEWLIQFLDYLKGNLVFLNDYIKHKMPKIKVIKPEGTYLVWLDFRELGFDKIKLSNFMIEKAKVALDDGYWFGTQGEGFERINIACPRCILEEGLNRIEKAMNNLD